MAGFRLPTNEKYLDLEPYGGEGKLCVVPVKIGDSIQLNEMIKDLAKRDGIEIKNDNDIALLATTKYRIESIQKTFESCVFAVEDTGKRKLTFEEIFSLPVELLEVIMNIINKSADFPLAQNAGKGQK